MNGFETRPLLATAAGLLALAAAAWPCGASSQLPTREAARSLELEILESLDQEQQVSGHHSAQLIEPLMALGLSYQEDGDHALATVAFAQARQIVRVNYGFSSIDEALLLRQMVRSEEAMGNVEGAWKLELELLELIRLHPNDLRTVPIYHEIADRRRDVLARYDAGEFPPQIVLGCYYRSLRGQSCHSGSRRQVISALSSEIDDYRDEAERVERWARGCARSPAPEIPDGKELSKRERATVRKDVHEYVAAMADYVGCVQARYDAAASADAPSSILSQLESQHSAAVAETQRVIATYDNNLPGPITSLELLLATYRIPSESAPEP